VTQEQIKYKCPVRDSVNIIDGSPCAIPSAVCLFKIKEDGIFVCKEATKNSDKRGNEDGTVQED
jgi:hypothetical protein